MRSPLRRTVLVLAGLALLGAACRDGGSPTGAAPAGDEARVGFSLNVAGTSVTTIAVEVTAPDITSRLVFNIEAVDGVATGSITIPAGADRTITARAYDAKGILTHQGSKVVTVKGGANPSITITLVPATGEQPLSISFGALVVQVSRVTPTAAAEIGDTVRFKAVVRSADGTPVNGKVRWASLNPGMATVDSLGLVTARRPGQAEIVATYQGAGGSGTLTVLGDGTDGSRDQTAPHVTALAFADSINIAAGDSILDLTVNAADAGSGVQIAYVTFSAPLRAGSERRHTRFCGAADYNNPAQPGGANQVSWKCRVIFGKFDGEGTWAVTTIQIHDHAGNYKFISGSQLAASGVKTSLKVANANADTTPPTASTLLVALDSINVTTATDTTVTVTVTASDTGSGIEWIEVWFRGPSGQLGPYCSANSYSLPPSAATNQVTWSCKVPFRRASAAGTYKLSHVMLHDRVKNQRIIDGAQPPAGWPTGIRVVK